MRLAGSVALVTGAGSGLGRGIAQRFAVEGAQLALADLDVTAAEETLDSFEAPESQGAGEHARHLVHETDVSSGRSVEGLMSETMRVLGPPDVIVNCAGINNKVPFLDLTESDWDRMLDVNLKGTFLVSLLGARLMRPGGAIINISSVNADLTTGDIVHYAASKGGVRSLTKAVAVALAPRRIRVNAIAPGPCETNLTLKARQNPEGMARLLSRVALGRLGTPDDIAGIALFLASDESAFVTGTTVYADGGLSAVR